MHQKGPSRTWRHNRGVVRAPGRGPAGWWTIDESGEGVKDAELCIAGLPPRPAYGESLSRQVTPLIRQTVSWCYSFASNGGGMFPFGAGR